MFYLYIQLYHAKPQHHIRKTTISDFVMVLQYVYQEQVWFYLSLVLAGVDRAVVVVVVTGSAEVVPVQTVGACTIRIASASDVIAATTMLWLSKANFAFSSNTLSFSRL